MNFENESSFVANFFKPKVETRQERFNSLFSLNVESSTRMVLDANFSVLK